MIREWKQMRNKEVLVKKEENIFQDEREQVSWRGCGITSLEDLNSNWKTMSNLMLRPTLNTGLD